MSKGKQPRRKRTPANKLRIVLKGMEPGIFEALPEEKQVVRSYALQHAEIRHSELAWRMIDEDVAYLSIDSVPHSIRGKPDESSSRA